MKINAQNTVLVFIEEVIELQPDLTVHQTKLQNGN